MILECHNNRPTASYSDQFLTNWMLMVVTIVPVGVLLNTSTDGDQMRWQEVSCPSGCREVAIHCRMRESNVKLKLLAD